MDVVKSNKNFLGEFDRRIETTERLPNETNKELYQRILVQIFKEHGITDNNFKDECVKYLAENGRIVL